MLLVPHASGGWTYRTLAEMWKIRAELEKAFRDRWIGGPNKPAERCICDLDMGSIEYKEVMEKITGLKYELVVEYRAGRNGKINKRQWYREVLPLDLDAQWREAEARADAWDAHNEFLMDQIGQRILSENIARIEAFKQEALKKMQLRMDDSDTDTDMGMGGPLLASASGGSPAYWELLPVDDVEGGGGDKVSKNDAVGQVQGAFDKEGRFVKFNYNTQNVGRLEPVYVELFIIPALRGVKGFLNLVESLLVTPFAKNNNVVTPRIPNWPKPPSQGRFRIGKPSRAKPAARGEKSYYDQHGGEWRWDHGHKPDYKPHWDYKPPGKNTPWENIYPN